MKKNCGNSKCGSLNSSSNLASLGQELSDLLAICKSTLMLVSLSRAFSDFSRGDEEVEVRKRVRGMRFSRIQIPTLECFQGYIAKTNKRLCKSKYGEAQLGLLPNETPLLLACTTVDPVGHFPHPKKQDF